MALNITELAADLAEIIADEPVSMTWGAQTISVAISPLSKTRDVDPSGILTPIDMTVLAPMGSFSGSVLPDTADVVTINSVQYHIAQRVADSVSVVLTLRRV